MKTTITIEQFDNGISIKETDEDGDTQAIVSLDRTKEEEIGKVIWEDIKNMMDDESANIVTMNIEITTD
jgi:hypothetical protein